jgi:hypothetical protein
MLPPFAPAAETWARTLTRLSIFALLLLPSRARIVVSYILSLPLLRRGTSLVVVRPIGGVIAGKKVAANAAAIGGRGGGQIWRLGGH